MRTFEKYFEYIKSAFSSYPRIVVEIYNQNEWVMMVRIRPQYTNENAKGCLEIRLDQETIACFGDFFPDDYLDDSFDNSWEKYSEKQIFEFLDKKIAEYKHYIGNGYFFAFCYSNNEVEALWPHLYTGDFNKIDYEKLYLSQNSEGVDYDQIKSVTVTNFYGDIIVDNKILH